MKNGYAITIIKNIFTEKELSQKYYNSRRQYMKKKILIVILIILAILIGSFFLGGLRKRTDVVLANYSISEDGTKIKLNTLVTSSMGYIRDLNVEHGGDNNYITFYSTFGLGNNKMGAKNEFEIELNPFCREIYFYSGNGGYKLVLKKDETSNKWTAVK